MRRTGCNSEKTKKYVNQQNLYCHSLLSTLWRHPCLGIQQTEQEWQSCHQIQLTCTWVKGLAEQNNQKRRHARVLNKQPWNPIVMHHVWCRSFIAASTHPLLIEHLPASSDAAPREFQSASPKMDLKKKLRYVCAHTAVIVLQKFRSIDLFFRDLCLCPEADCVCCQPALSNPQPVMNNFHLKPQFAALND